MDMSDGTDRPKVLIADDVDENRELLRETIEPHGFDAFLVPNGSLAIRVAKRVLPDLILLVCRDISY
jgi:CheY-like chemotaxis protein